MCAVLLLRSLWRYNELMAGGPRLSDTHKVAVERGLTSWEQGRVKKLSERKYEVTRETKTANGGSLTLVIDLGATRQHCPEPRCKMSPHPCGHYWAADFFRCNGSYEQWRLTSADVDYHDSDSDSSSESEEAEEADETEVRDDSDADSEGPSSTVDKGKGPAPDSDSSDEYDDEGDEAETATASSEANIGRPVSYNNASRIRDHGGGAKEAEKAKKARKDKTSRTPEGFGTLLFTTRKGVNDGLRGVAKSQRKNRRPSSDGEPANSPTPKRRQTDTPKKAPRAIAPAPGSPSSAIEFLPPNEPWCDAGGFVLPAIIGFAEASRIKSPFPPLLDELIRRDGDTRLAMVRAHYTTALLEANELEYVRELWRTRSLRHSAERSLRSSFLIMFGYGVGASDPAHLIDFVPSCCSCSFAKSSMKVPSVLEATAEGRGLFDANSTPPLAHVAIQSIPFVTKHTRIKSCTAGHKLPHVLADFTWRGINRVIVPVLVGAGDWKVDVAEFATFGGSNQHRLVAVVYGDGEEMTARAVTADGSVREWASATGRIRTTLRKWTDLDLMTRLNMESRRASLAVYVQA